MQDDVIGFIDLAKIDVTIEAHYAPYAPDSLNPAKKANGVNQFFQFSGGSANAVGTLVKETEKNGGFSDCVLKVDSETIAEWDVIKYLKADATKTKHAEKLTPIDIFRSNSINRELAKREDISQQTPPYRTTQFHEVYIPLYGKIPIQEGYIFSDKEGEMFFSGMPHQETFQAVLRYITRKVFEVAASHGITTTLVIDDHLEDLESAKDMIATAKRHGAETMFIQSYVKPEVSIERAAGRFAKEGRGEDIAFRINRISQIRTHLHQARNWRELSKEVDGAILTHRNIEGQPPVVIQAVVNVDGVRYERTGPNKQSWLESFYKIDRLPKDPEKALYELGFAPSTSPFAKWVEGTSEGKLTPLEALMARKNNGSRWVAVDSAER